MSTLTPLFCLLLIRNTQVVSQSLCNDRNYLEVKEDENITFTCTGLTGQQTVTWFWESALLTTCTLSGCQQVLYPERFSVNRPEATYSNITVYPSGFLNLDYLATTNLSCQTNNSKATCQLDVIYPAESSKCQIQFSGDTWEVTGWCNISKVRSRRDRYGCYLYQTSVVQDSPATSVGDFTMNTTNITGTNYSSGVCQIKSVLPPEGTYNYSVIIIPGEVKVLPSFNGSNKIQLPSQSPQHNCSQNVTEGDTIDCLCYSKNLGAPSGSLIWKGTNSSRLKIDNVNRTYSGTSNICSLMWNNSAVQNVTYEVAVNYASRVLSFRINNKTDTIVNVSESTKVSVVCQAEGRPGPTIRIFKRSGDNQTLIVTNDTLELQHNMTAMNCETTGNYTCESENSVSVDRKYIILIASCSPQKRTNDSYSTTFEADIATLTFQMIAHPLPDLLSIFYMGSENNSTSEEIEHENTTRSTCSSENMFSSLVSCDVTLHNETVYATGFYMATFVNSFGNISFYFEIKVKIHYSTAKATSATDSYSPVTEAVVGVFIGGVVGGVVGGIVLITVSVAVIIFIVRRRRKSSKEPTLKNTCMEETLSQEQNIEADTAQSMYSVVNKNKKGSKSTKELTPTDTYATVDKKGAEHASKKKPNKRKKKEKAEALSRSSVTDFEYQNFDENEQGKEMKGANEIQRRNQQGLLYTTVVFDNTLSTSPPKSESSEIVYSEIVPR